jgi:Tfp pilus assembly protein PilO
MAKFNINIDRKNRQTYFYSALFLCVLLSGLIIFSAIVPKVRQWLALKKDISNREMELEKRYKTAEENKQLKKDILVIEKKYDEISGSFFELSDFPAAIKEISDISQDLRIEFMSIVPQALQEIKEPSLGYTLWKMPLSIKIKTDYSKLVKFIKRLENARKFLKVENLSIKKGKAEKGNLLALKIHDVEMTVYAYSLQQKKI